MTIFGSGISLRKKMCIYKCYNYDVENIWHGLFILYPSEHKTRIHLKLYIYDDSRIEVPCEEFIASSHIMMERESLYLTLFLM